MSRRVSHHLVMVGMLCALAAGYAPLGIAQTGTAPGEVESTEPLEPDYAVVAEDARKIADEIEERLIASHMTDASIHLNETDPVTGYPKAEEAYVDMEEMISFCESTSNKAGSACRFKLKISMQLNPGSTLGQLGNGMKPGSGYFGGPGNGQGGSGGSMSFGMYGPESFGDPIRRSKRLGDKKARNSQSAPGVPDPLANSVEETRTATSRDIDFNAEGGERVLEEYQQMVDEYFKELSKE